MGKAGLIAGKVSATLASTGTPSIFLHPAEAVHGDLGRVVQGDLVLAFSKSGETEELLRFLPVVKASGVPLLAITETKDSTLGQLADLVLEMGPIDEAGEHGLAPSASTVAMLALGDALALVVQEGRNFGPEEFARFHPAGSLGRRLLRIKEIMRKGERNPLVPQGATLRETLFVMTKTPGHPGAALVVDQEQRLVGIFTDGDLRRCLEKGIEGLLDRRIDSVMTRSPRKISQDRLAAEAFNQLKENRVDQLPVVDELGKAVGILDVQDLLELKIAP
jgi:arabinose-5-phosphate isomerase